MCMPVGVKASEPEAMTAAPAALEAPLVLLVVDEAAHCGGRCGGALSIARGGAAPEKTSGGDAGADELATAPVVVAPASSVVWKDREIGEDRYSQGGAMQGLPWARGIPRGRSASGGGAPSAALREGGRYVEAKHAEARGRLGGRVEVSLTL